MVWYVYASWYMSGAILGLTIAQLMVQDATLSCGLLMWTLAILAINLVLLLCIVWRATR